MQAAGFKQADAAYQSRTASKSKSVSSSNLQQTGHEGHTRCFPQRSKTIWHKRRGEAGLNTPGGNETQVRRMRVIRIQTDRGWEDRRTDRHILRKEGGIQRHLHGSLSTPPLQQSSAIFIFRFVTLPTFSELSQDLSRCPSKWRLECWAVYTQRNYISPFFRWLLMPQLCRESRLKVYCPWLLIEDTSATDRSKLEIECVARWQPWHGKIYGGHKRERRTGDMGEQGLIGWPGGVRHCGYTLRTSSINEQKETHKKIASDCPWKGTASFLKAFIRVRRRGWQDLSLSSDQFESGATADTLRTNQGL